MNLTSTFGAVSTNRSDGDGYFKTLFGCMVFSLLLLVGAHVGMARFGQALPPWTTIAAAAVPLVYYHLFYLTPKAKKGLSQTAIDSVYYYGFLVTVAALGISAVSIATSGAANNLETVIFQFGVGLFATGYAVIARMHLSSTSKMLDDASPDAVIDSYIAKSKTLVDNLDLTLNSFSQLTARSNSAIEGLDSLGKTIMEKSAETAARAQLLATKSVQDAARSFDEEMRSVLALTKDGLIQMKGLISDTAFVTEREELGRSVKATIEVTTRLTQQLSELTESSKVGALATRTASAAQDGLSKSLISVTQDLEHLAGPEGVLSPAVVAISSAASATALAATEIQTVLAQLQGMAKDATEATTTQHKLARTVKRVDEQLGVLGEASDRFSKSLERIQEAAAGSVVAYDRIDRVVEVLPKLAESASSLTESLAGVRNVANFVGAQIEVLPTSARQAAAANSAIVDSLELIAASLKRASAEATNLSSGTETANTTLQGAERLLATASSLESVLKSVEASFARLPVAFQAVERDLAESTARVKATVTSSADALAGDVQRTAAASTLFSTKLADVAQMVIDRTRGNQPGASL